MTGRSLVVVASCVAALTGPCVALAQGLTIRDSAGIRIVENVAPMWNANDAWRLETRPVVDIGAEEGDPDYELYQVVGALRLNNGCIVIANAGTSQLRFYDAAGRYVRAAGGKGGGPGEFLWIRWLGRTVGDTLLVYDGQNALRISVFDSSGELVRTLRLQPVEGRKPAHPIGAFADGSLLIGTSYPTTRQPKPTPVRFPVRFFRYISSGRVADTVLTLHSEELFLQSVPAQVGGLAYWNLAFGRRMSVRLARERVYTGDGTTYEVRVYSSKGVLERLIRVLQPRLPVEAKDIEQYKLRQLENARGPFASLAERLLNEMPFPDSMPAFAGLEVDPVGNLWVEEYRRPGDDLPRWTIFDPTGTMLGTIALPERFALFQVGSDFVLGKWQDELDVEHVRLYELIKP